MATAVVAIATPRTNPRDHGEPCEQEYSDDRHRQNGVDAAERRGEGHVDPGQDLRPVGREANAAEDDESPEVRPPDQPAERREKHFAANESHDTVHGNLLASRVGSLLVGRKFPFNGAKNWLNRREIFTSEHSILLQNTVFVKSNKKPLLAAKKLLAKEVGEVLAQVRATSPRPSSDAGTSGTGNVLGQGGKRALFFNESRKNRLASPWSPDKIFGQHPNATRGKPGLPKVLRNLGNLDVRVKYDVRVELGACGAHSTSRMIHFNRIRVPPGIALSTALERVR